MRTLESFDVAANEVVSELTVLPKDRSKKSRNVISLRGDWRMIQSRLYRKLFLPKCKPFPSSFGGVRGKSATDNARAHLANTHAYVTDISSFFPSISSCRVNKFFLSKSCSYDVARVLTRLCTYEHHLALGLITSPIIANEIFRSIDREIRNACRSMDLQYSRFVDDITISGRFDLRRCGIRTVVQKIIRRHYFQLAESKTQIGLLDREIVVTGVRIKKHGLDASKEFIRELDRLIEDHSSLAMNGEFNGPLMTEGEILGKSHFAIGLNPGRRRALLGRIGKIDWGAVSFFASERGLQRTYEEIVPRGSELPSSANIGEKETQQDAMFTKSRE